MLGLNALRIGLVLVLAAVFTIPGCDTLVTEVNNNIIYDSTLGQSCLNGCHSDNNNLITVPKGQWLASAHASPEFIEAHVMLNGQEFFTNNAECGATCHTSEGFIDFAENGTSSTQATPSPIGCYTCHMPHSGNFGEWRLDSLRGQTDMVLLASGGYNMGKSNMCVQCHQAVNPAPTGADDIVPGGKWGPHFSPQAEVIAGLAGYRFGAEVTDTITHAGITGKDGCLSCHFGYPDGIGAGYQFGEHTFRLEDSLGVQFHETCNITGCHKTEAITDFYSSTTVREIDSLAALIKDSLWGRNILDTSDQSGMSFYADSTLNKYNVPILYNYLLYKGDGSRGVHNPVLMHALLSATALRLDTLPPQANFELVNPADTLTCLQDVTVIQFINTSLENGATFEWSVGGNASPKYTTDANHVYDSEGIYDVRLIATGPGDHVDTITKENFIVVEDVPVAGFAADEVTFCKATNVAFSNQSVFARSWFWDFGDGNTDTVQNPTHTYDTVGAYTVTLAVDGLCGVDTLVLTDYIHLRDAGDIAVASFSISPNPAQDSTTVTFTNLSLFSDVWYWDFGDGNYDSSGTTFNATHSYDSTGTFDVTLTAVNGCNDSTIVETVEIID